MRSIKKIFIQSIDFMFFLWYKESVNEMEVENMIIWVIKMLLKFMKPLAKIAIKAGLLESILDSFGEDDSDDTEQADENAEG